MRIDWLMPCWKREKVEPDLRVVLDAWRKLLVENDRLQQENQHLRMLIDSVQLVSFPVGLVERGKRIKESDRE